MIAKFVLVVGFIVAFSAGLVSGLVVRGREVQAMPGATTRRVGGPGTGGPYGLLAAELALTPGQREQMTQIWAENARGLRHQQDQRRGQYRRERDEAIAALIRSEDKPKYEQVVRTYGERMSGLEKELRASWQSAVEQTKAILTPEQRTKYEEFLKRREAERGGGPGGGGGRDRGAEHEQQNRRADERATSRPGSAN